MPIKTLHDEQGNEYRVEFSDEDEDEESEEDETNIYLTEADVRWIKQMRKRSEGSGAKNVVVRRAQEENARERGKPRTKRLGLFNAA